MPEETDGKTDGTAAGAPEKKRGRPARPKAGIEKFRCPACDSLLELKAGRDGYRCRENIHARKLAALEARVSRRGVSGGDPGGTAEGAAPAAGAADSAAAGAACKHGHQRGCVCLDCWYRGCWVSAF